MSCLIREQLGAWEELHVPDETDQLGVAAQHQPVLALCDYVPPRLVCDLLEL